MANYSEETSAVINELRANSVATAEGNEVLRSVEVNFEKLENVFKIMSTQLAEQNDLLRRSLNVTAEQLERDKRESQLEKVSKPEPPSSPTPAGPGFFNMDDLKKYSPTTTTGLMNIFDIIRKGAMYAMGASVLIGVLERIAKGIEGIPDALYKKIWGTEDPLTPEQVKKLIEDNEKIIRDDNGPGEGNQVLTKQELTNYQDALEQLFNDLNVKGGATEDLTLIKKIEEMQGELDARLNKIYEDDDIDEAEMEEVRAIFAIVEKLNQAIKDAPPERKAGLENLFNKTTTMYEELKEILEEKAGPSSTETIKNVTKVETDNTNNIANLGFGTGTYLSQGTVADMLKSQASLNFTMSNDDPFAMVGGVMRPEDQKSAQEDRSNIGNIFAETIRKLAGDLGGTGGLIEGGLTESAMKGQPDNFLHAGFDASIKGEQTKDYMSSVFEGPFKTMDPNKIAMATQGMIGSPSSFLLHAPTYIQQEGSMYKAGDMLNQNTVVASAGGSGSNTYGLFPHGYG